MAVMNRSIISYSASPSDRSNDCRRAHHLVADGADGPKQFGIKKLGGIVGGQLSPAADVAGQQEHEIGELVGGGAQPELGVARRGGFISRALVAWMTGAK